MTESFFHGEKIAADSKFVYLLVNENGDSKIGISVNPFARARTLENASGYKIDKICYWEVYEAATQIESLLLSF